MYLYIYIYIYRERERENYYLSRRMERLLYWLVVGGAETGGIIVRSGQDRHRCTIVL